MNYFFNYLGFIEKFVQSLTHDVSKQDVRVYGYRLI